MGKYDKKPHHKKRRKKAVARNFNFRCICISRKYLLDLDIDELCPPCPCHKPLHVSDHNCFCC